METRRAKFISLHLLSEREYRAGYRNSRTGVASKEDSRHEMLPGGPELGNGTFTPDSHPGTLAL